MVAWAKNELARLSMQASPTHIDCLLEKFKTEQTVFGILVITTLRNEKKRQNVL